MGRCRNGATREGHQGPDAAREDTYADYLAAEQTSESRLELIDGVIVAMAGGSHEHNAIAGRFAGALSARVPATCFYYTPDQRFWIAATARGRYSGGSIICGKPANPAHDAQAMARSAATSSRSSLCRPM